MMPENDAAISPVLQDEAVLNVSSLSKYYGKIAAVKDVSFAIRRGECFGLLGPNGAGKTTTVEIMEGIRKPTAGTVRYRGRLLARHYRAEMGIQFQATALPEHLTVREVLRLFADLYPKTLPVEEVADLCSLRDFLERDTRKLSGGQVQRLLLGIALVNDPAVLFLDEPTTGLDPQARRNFWSLVESIKRQGKTLVLTTHYMEEAYVLCDRVAIMDRGQIIAEGSPEGLLKKHFEGVRVLLPTTGLPFGAEEIPWPSFLTGLGLEIHTTDLRKTLEFLLGRGIPLEGMEVRSQTLEDLFLELTGRGLRE